MRMSGPVIIRLQNLPLEARSIDIRRFFDGLQIPDGGVHIIGGEKGDAFIAFQSDEDARQAMARDGLPLCNARIKLFLSSKTEMQNVIAAARNQQLAPAAPIVPVGLPKTTLPSSIEQILFKPSQPVVAAKPALNSSNPAELLSNLTKFFSTSSSSSSSSGAAPVGSQPAQVESKPITKPELDPIKALANLLPMITQQQKSATAAPVMSHSISQPQLASQQTAQTNASGAKMSINQMLEMIQTHLKQPESSELSQKSAPGSDYGSRDYNSTSHRSEYSSSSQPSYSQSRNGGSAPMPYRHEAAPPAGSKYASTSSNGTSGVPSSQPQKLDPIIRVKNFAPSASYKEIRTFLQGVQIEHDGIKLLYDGNNQKTGQAFVRLIGIIDLKKALCRNKQFYEDRQIEVLQSNEHEFATTNVLVEYPAMQRHKNMRQQQQQQAPHEMRRDRGDRGGHQEMEQDAGQHGFYLKIYGLPASFDDQSLKNMFNNVKFVKISTAKPTPISTKIVNADGTTENTTIVKAKKLCQVETQLDLERALTRQDERVGKSKVQIFQISKSEYDREIASIPANRDKQRGHQNNNGNNGSNFTNGGGRSGDHGGSSNTEYMDTNERSENDENGGGLGDDLYLYMHGVPFSAREHEVKSFFADNAQPRFVHFLIDPESLRSTGECVCEFASRSDRERALGRDGQLMRNRVIKMRPIGSTEYRQYLSNLDELRDKQPKRGARQALLHTPVSSNEKPRLLSETLINLMKNQTPLTLKRSAPHVHSGQQKRLRSSPEPGSPNTVELPPLPPELQRYKKSIVLLSNVSYEATREDILDLFRPFSAIEQTLKIRHDDNGQPTGDAIVACKNADEAMNACGRLNGFNFMGRSIRAVLFES